MRPVTARFLRETRAQETDAVFLLLVTIDHEALAEPIRVVDNNEDIESRGETYVAYPVEIVLPSLGGDRPGRARLRIDNVDREIVATLRAITTPPTVTIEAIVAAQPDTVEASFDALTLTDAEWDALTVEGDLAYEDLLNEPYPGVRYTPATAPGLFP